MPKISWAILPIAALLLSGCPSREKPDVSKLTVGIPHYSGEFCFEAPRDSKRAGPEWIYVMRISHGENAWVVVDLFVARNLKSDEYVLSLFEATKTVSWDDYAKMYPDEKIAASTKKRAIDRELVGKVYEIMGGALLRARYSHTGAATDAGTSTVTVYSMDGGFLSGVACAGKDGARTSTAGGVAEVARQLRRYLDADEKGSSEIRATILRLCDVHSKK